MSAERPFILATYLKKICRVAWIALRKYLETDGEQRAASFAYYALFALFPLLVLCVTVSSQFINKQKASEEITNLISNYIPMGDEGEEAVIKTVSGVVNSRTPVGIFAVLAVVWGSLGFFHALVRGVNRAWGTLEYPWYRLPFKNLAMVGIVASALFLGIIVPVIIQAIQQFIWNQNPTIWANMFFTFRAAQQLLPSLVLFYAFSMFYKFAPRGSRQFSEVWIAAIVVTFTLQGLRKLFMLYTTSFIHFNKLYGAFGGIIALLMWIYLTGTMIIFGGCLCAAQAEVAERRKNDESLTSD